MQRRSGERGQALVEFAIVIPVFVLLLAGMIQFGIILWGQNTLNQVVRDAGRYAATLKTCTNEPTIASGGLVTTRVTGLTNASAGPWTIVLASAKFTGTVGPDCPPKNKDGQRWVTVEASYDVPIFFPWVPGNGRLSSSTEFRMEPTP